MKVTEVRVYPPVPGRRPSRMLAHASVTFDGEFVVHGVRVVSRPDGRLLVCMPDRRVERPCGHCNWLSPVVGRFCGGCGAALGPPASEDVLGTSRGFIDIAHPTNSAFRAYLTEEVMAEYNRVVSAAAAARTPPATVSAR